MKPLKLKSNITVHVGIPWLRDHDEFSSHLPHCLNAIEAQETSIKILKPQLTSTYSGKFEEGQRSLLYAIMDRMNAVIEGFTQSKATHLWMVDADVEPPPHALETLLRHDADLASGVYPFHNWRDCHAMMGGRIGEEECGFFVPRNWDYMKGHVLGVNERVSAGSGCLLIKRRVVMRHHPKISPLRFDKKDGRCGADVYFWKRAQDAGFTARLDANVVCGHRPGHPLSKIEEWLI